MSSPPPNNDQSSDNPISNPSNGQSESTLEGSGPSNTNRPASPARQFSPLPSISFSIAIPRPSTETSSPSPRPSTIPASDPTITAGVTPRSNDTQEHPNQAGSFSSFWTFTIRPDDQESPATTNPSTVQDQPRPEGTNLISGDNTNNTNTQSQRTNVQEGTPQVPGPAAPPWIFPPFFNFFLPIRSEPQPNPEKATELLRSLPTVGRRLLMRVDRIVAAQENDRDTLPEERGWKCGICLEGLDIQAEHEKSKEIKGKEKEQEEVTTDILMEEKEKEETEVRKKDSKNTGVKALPCNHLFHEECLHPWFTTKHTCPSCRLDLDPLQTLNSPSTTDTTLRPGQTGSGRRLPHPYARDRPANDDSARSDSTATETTNVNREPPAGLEHLGRLLNGIHGPGLIPSVGISGNGLPREDDRPTITFIFNGSPPEGFNLPGLTPGVFGPPGLSARTVQSGIAPSSVPASNPTAPASDTSLASAPTDPNAQSHTREGDLSQNPEPAPSTPGSVFDVPTFFSSPLPITNRVDSSPASDQQMGSETGQLANTAPNMALNSESHTAATATLAPSASDSDRAPPANPEERPRPERRPHITIIRTSSPTPRPPAGPGHNSGVGLPTSGPPGGLGLGNLPLPPFLFPNLPLPPQLLNAPAAPTGPPSPGQANQARSPSPAPFVPQSLESWTQEKEKSLGWRCDASNCHYAPSVNEEDDDVEMSEICDDNDQGNKEMLTVYLEDLYKDNQITTGDQDNHVVLTKGSASCGHKLHRKCLELSENLSGRITKQDDEEGKVWVKCEKCKKDGWVKSRLITTTSINHFEAKERNLNDEINDDEEEYAPSEKEVENLINL
ncbi:uncharacterized protein I206_100275 [Kwoniella pini CBS 10737]|uniref:RING-type domain-containing protein n=1 Tax=Kwoniella pini CBS 10737 TaxID=1296096 RepID=A0A1B9IDX9_9TREE|nr:uncharacterized protein I206_01050 [Kwoniella pini CBS 10737]OCF53743.1 hypothetical protein I206_01050 [Kwoniella pini CBS 10737]